jgi:hypothetical protein
MRAKQELVTYVQSLIDTSDQDPEAWDLLNTVAMDRFPAQMVDNVKHMAWFKQAVWEYIASHEGVKNA